MSRRVRTQRGLGRLRKTPPDRGQVLEDRAPCAREVGSVVEHDLDERRSEERVATDRLGTRDFEHLRGHQVGDLLFDDLGCLARDGEDEALVPDRALR